MDTTFSSPSSFMKETPIPCTPTSLGKWALLLVQALDSYKLDSQQIFLSAGVALEDIKKNNARIPSAAMVQVWQQGLALSQDPYLSLRVAKLFLPAAFGSLGLSLSASEHAHAALQRACRYSQVISNDAMVSLIEDEREVALTVNAGVVNEVKNYTGLEAVFACMLMVLRSVAGQEFKAQEVNFKHGFTGNKKPFEAFFKCPVYFSSNENRLVFNRENLFKPQAFSNTGLSEKLDRWIEEDLYQSRQQRLVPRVKKIIECHLAQGECHLPIISAQLAMSTRVLQRRLKSEGTSFSELYDECRQQLALKLIVNPRHTLAYVSELLGFNNPGNFTRAFKRWAGVTPQVFRDR